MRKDQNNQDRQLIARPPDFTERYNRADFQKKRNELASSEISTFEEFVVNNNKAWKLTPRDAMQQALQRVERGRQAIELFSKLSTDKASLYEQIQRGQLDDKKVQQDLSTYINNALILMHHDDPNKLGARAVNTIQRLDSDQQHDAVRALAIADIAWYLKYKSFEAGSGRQFHKGSYFITMDDDAANKALFSYLRSNAEPRTAIEGILKMFASRAKLVSYGRGSTHYPKLVTEHFGIDQLKSEYRTNPNIGFPGDAEGMRTALFGQLNHKDEYNQQIFTDHLPKGEKSQAPQHFFYFRNETFGLDTSRSIASRMHSILHGWELLKRKLTEVGLLKKHAMQVSARENAINPEALALFKKYLHTLGLSDSEIAKREREVSAERSRGNSTIRLMSDIIFKQIGVSVHDDYQQIWKNAWAQDMENILGKTWYLQQGNDCVINITAQELAKKIKDDPNLEQQTEYHSNAIAELVACTASIELINQAIAIINNTPNNAEEACDKISKLELKKQLGLSFVTTKLQDELANILEETKDASKLKEKLYEIQQVLVKQREDLAQQYYGKKWQEIESTIPKPDNDAEKNSRHLSGRASKVSSKSAENVKVDARRTMLFSKKASKPVEPVVNDVNNKHSISQTDAITPRDDKPTREESKRPKGS